MEIQYHLENTLKNKKKKNYFIIKLILLIIFIYLLNKFEIISFLNPIDSILKSDKNNKNYKPSLIERFLNIYNLKTPNKKAYKLLIPDELNIFKLGYEQSGTYLENILNIFKKTIYPIELYQIGQDYKIIDQINNKNLDLAFVDENTLMEYKKNKELKANVICVAFKQHMLFITLEKSQIYTFNQLIQNKIQVDEYNSRNIKIGVLNKNTSDYLQLITILNTVNLNIVEDIDVIEFETYFDLRDAIINQTVDVIFLNTLQKNQIIETIIKEVQCKFISPIVNKQSFTISDTFAYLSTRTKPTINILFNKNKILYVKDDERFLIELLKLCEIYFEMKYQDYLEMFCISNLTNEDLLTKFLDVDNFNKSRNHFIFLPQTSIFNSRKRQLFNILNTINLTRNLIYDVLYLKSNDEFKLIIEEEFARKKKKL